MAEPFSNVAFLDALAHFASGVVVVTARGEGKTAADPAGFTASAFTSASLTPPLVLVCVRQTGSAHDAVVGAELFGVSILADRQAWIAEQFARSGVDRFENVPLRLEGDVRVPLVEGALAHLECRRHSAHTAGDHTILVGEVERCWIAPGRPLVHFGRKFGAFVADSARLLPSDDVPAVRTSKGERA
jgi:flavin reductase (DIM6/NTAB) family NADH-FMN oxidoreductase RutF